MRSGWFDLQWELAVLIIIEVVLALVAISFEALQFLALIAFPVPAAVIVRKYHLFVGVITLFLVTLMLYFILFDLFEVVSIILGPAIIGLAMGLLFKNHVKPGRSIFVLIFISIVVTTGLLAGTYSAEGINPFNMGRENFAGIEEASEFYRETGLLSEEEQEQVQNQLREIVNLFVILVPGNIVIWSVILTFISYLLAIKVFGRMGYNVRGIPSYRTWSLPWQVIWGIIIGLILFMAGNEWNIDWIRNTGINILYVFSFFFMVAGISVLAYFIKSWRAKTVFKVIIIVLLVIYWPVGAGLVLGLGLLDAIANLRKLKLKSK